MSDPEAATRAMLRRALQGDFHVHDGWSGLHKHGGELVKYDLVLSPREHLLAQGFDPGYVILEVKLFDSSDKKKHDVKVRDLLWQCVAYSYSSIKLPLDEYERPLFVVYFVGGEGPDTKGRDELNALHHFVQRGGVGCFSIHPDGAWDMRFGGSFYFRSKHGRGPHRVGIKRQTGSSR